MNEERAVEALKRFGLSTYEARVLVGLNRLGTGTASDISEVVDVPRSQVYGAAEGLNDRGLIEVQHGSPMRYRPVGIDEAREKLFQQLESEGEAAFEHLEEVRETTAVPEDDRESIWTSQGGTNVAERVAALIRSAERQVTYGVEDPGLVEAPVRAALTDRGDELTIALVTADPESAAAFEELGVGEVRRLEESISPADIRGRTLVVDGETLLLSVLPTENFPHLASETAYWSESTGFATMLGSILEAWYDSLAE